MKNNIRGLILFLITCYLFSCGKDNNSKNLSTADTSISIEISILPPIMTYADNISLLTIITSVKNEYGEPLTDKSVTLSCNGTGFSLFPNNSQISNSSGQSNWTLKSSLEGVRIITATVSGTLINDSTTVYFYNSIGGISQPDGTLIPSQISCNGGQSNGLGVIFASQCIDEGISNIGNPCSSPLCSCDDGTNSTCETTLWHTCNDNNCIPSQISGLNPRDAAFITPNTFRPKGDVTFKLLSRGLTLFKNAFGWYNVTGSKPDSNDLHIIHSTDKSTGTSVTTNILNDPFYKGGLIGFFLITPESHTNAGTCAEGNCSATIERAYAGNGYIYYSERNFNPDWAGTSSRIHLLNYVSQVWEDTFYLAWEDQYNNTSNDFTDFVVSVTGLKF